MNHLTEDMGESIKAMALYLSRRTVEEWEEHLQEALEDQARNLRASLSIPNVLPDPEELAQLDEERFIRAGRREIDELIRLVEGPGVKGRRT